MRNLTLILSVVALIGAIASGVLFFIIGNSKQELLHRWQNTDAQLTATAAQLKGAQRDNEELQNQVRVLDADLATHKRDLTALRLEAEQMQQSLEILEQARTVAVETRHSALVDLDQATENLANLRRQLAESVSPAEVQQYQQTIADLEARIAPLEHRLAQKMRPPHWFQVAVIMPRS
jgi:peptidoglycan hydrolase CwlO-like protein